VSSSSGGVHGGSVGGRWSDLLSSIVPWRPRRLGIGSNNSLISGTANEIQGPECFMCLRGIDAGDPSIRGKKIYGCECKYDAETVVDR
jgi:hypothetical protein